MIKLNKDKGANQLTLSNLKSWMKVETTADDTLITTLISESRDILEAYLNVSLPLTTISAITSYTDKFELPYGPINEVYSVKDYLGNDLTYTFYNEEDIEIDTYYIEELYIVYNAGFSTLLNGYESGWKQIATYLYENRGDTEIYNFLSTNQTINLLRKKIWI